MNAWVVYHSNFPSSKLMSHRDFRLKLVEELVQPLLNLRASASCPVYLQTTKGRKPIATTESRLGESILLTRILRERSV